MQNYSVYASRFIDKDEPFTPGHRGCVGCCEALAVRQVCKALGRDVIVVNATGCLEIISSGYPNTNWDIPWIHTLFENTAAVAAGVDSALKALKRKGRYPQERRIKVVAMAGDGGTADIGFQALSGMLERGHNVLYICYDNEAYMNTGIQRSGATPYGATTTTSPASSLSIGQRTWKKNIPEIVAAHRIPYIATANPSYPFDLMDKVKKAVAIDGPAYLHVFAPCPTGWRSPTDTAVRQGRLAVLSGVFPLYEVENGNWKMTFEPEKLIPVIEYFKSQGRFKHLGETELEYIQKHVIEEYERLKKRCV